jgi:hypothetical protein
MTRIMLAVVCVWLTVVGPGLAFAQRPSEPKPAAPEEKPKPSAPGKPAAPAPGAAPAPAGTPGAPPPQTAPRSVGDLRPRQPQILADGTWRYRAVLGGGSIEGKAGGTLTFRDAKGNLLRLAGGRELRLGVNADGTLSQRTFEAQMRNLGKILSAADEAFSDMEAMKDLIKSLRTDDMGLYLGSYLNETGTRVDIYATLSDPPSGYNETTLVRHKKDGSSESKTTKTKKGDSGKKGGGIVEWPEESWSWDTGGMTFRQLVEQELVTQGLQQPIGQPTK